jgi:hypothetical protein
VDDVVLLPAVVDHAFVVFLLFSEATTSLRDALCP